MKTILRTLFITAAIACAGTGALADDYGQTGTHEPAESYSRMAPASGGTSAQTDLQASDVMDLQQALKDRGYSTGSADGILGAKTSAALRKFQTDNNLTVTGTATSETMTALGLSATPSSSAPTQ